MKISFKKFIKYTLLTIVGVPIIIILLIYLGIKINGYLCHPKNDFLFQVNNTIFAIPTDTFHLDFDFDYTPAKNTELNDRIVQREILEECHGLYTYPLKVAYIYIYKGYGYSGVPMSYMVIGKKNDSPEIAPEYKDVYYNCKECKKNPKKLEEVKKWNEHGEKLVNETFIIRTIKHPLFIWTVLLAIALFCLIKNRKQTNNNQGEQP